MDDIEATVMADTDDTFDAGHLVAGVVATGAVSLALVPAGTPVAVPVLVVLAYLCARLGGVDAGLGSVATAGFMFGWAITEPHFVWEIENTHDQVLLIVLFVASLAATALGSRMRRRHAGTPRH